MEKINSTFLMTNQPEYFNHFWDYMKGREGEECYLEAGKKDSASYVLPTLTSKKFSEKLASESLFRTLATCLYSRGSTPTIKARMNNDSATWVAEGGSIPVYDGMDDFTDYMLSNHKLAVVLKLDMDFLHDNSYIFESYFLDRLVKDFARAEEDGFINGNGTSEPAGLLHATKGAEVGVTAESLSFDTVIDLFFSLDPEYRKRAAWIMNDNTALALRKLTDENGNHLWNHTNDTILGKPVIISNFMPDAENGAKPILFGDFSYYWIVDRTPLIVRTLREKFFEAQQIGYLANERLDGRLIRPDAVKVLKIEQSEEE